MANVALVERLMNIVDHHLPNAFRSSGLFEQIGGKRRRCDIGKMLMLANCGELICIEAAPSNAVRERALSS